ncbi:MAG: tetratricopeptide repeat protein [Candidatus Thorarchaeota archaeon]
MSTKKVPSEFVGLFEDNQIPWDEIIERAKKKRKKSTSYFEVFTDVVVDLATKESMKEDSNSSILVLGLQACLVRGRLAEALFLSTDSDEIRVLSLRAVVLFVLSDVEGLRNVLSSIESKVSEKSLPVDQVRRSSARVMLAAAERDTNVIVCVMEFDNLLEENPEQVEEPIIETMFTLYVIATLLREVGEADRASRIVNTLEKMAKSQKHRMFTALVENLKGHICNFQGDLDKAEKHYLKLQKISEKMSFDLGIAMALNNLGTLKINSLRFEEALDLFQRSYEMMNVDMFDLRKVQRRRRISQGGNQTREEDSTRHNRSLHLV